MSLGQAVLQEVKVQAALGVGQQTVRSMCYLMLPILTLSMVPQKQLPLYL